MKDQTKDEPCSVDVARPRFLLRRYDSVSGSSDSSSRSSTSRGSFAQSPTRQQDPIGRRTRTNTFNSNYENGYVFCFVHKFINSKTYFYYYYLGFIDITI